MNEAIRLIEQLPYRRERFYRRDRRSVPAARRFARTALTDWGLAGAERSGDVSLCVSELATNALAHGVPPGRGFLLRIGFDGDVLRTEVHDSGAGEPGVVAESDGESGEGGRGLRIVAALSDKWGVGERYPGKVVWCEWVCV